MATIRKAKDSDARQIAAVYVETWRTTYAGAVPDRVLIGMSAERQAVNWARAIRGDGELIFVADDEYAGVIGVISGGPNRARGSDYTGEVYTLYVQPDFQNLGVGERLLARMFQELRGKGMNSAVIWVLGSNPSRFFYEAMGGKRVGERDEKLWGTTLREIAYGWLDLETALKAGRPALK